MLILIIEPLIFIRYVCGASGFHGEMDLHKRHVNLTRFCKSAISELLPNTVQGDCQPESK